MKSLILTLALLAFSAPVVALADNTCQTSTFTCQCLWGDTESPEQVTFNIAQDDIASCVNQCGTYLKNGDVDWIVECVDADGLPFPVDAGNLDVDNTTSAATTTEEKRDPVIPNLNVPIPGLDFGTKVTYDDAGNLQANFLAEYIGAVYSFAIVIMTIVAIVMMMVGGMQYIFARWHADAVKKAKQQIFNAVIGLIILFAAYDIAFLINPDTVSFSALSIKTVQYEEVPEEFAEEMESYGQTGDVPDGDIIDLPSDANSDHIIANAKDTQMAQEVYDALAVAATDFYNDTMS